MEIEEILNKSDEKLVEIVIKEFTFIECEIERIFDLIRESTSFENTDIHFNFLDRIQLMLAKVAFKYHVTLSERLRKFVHDFDRLDDIDLRKYIFLLIKDNNYHI